MNDASELVTVWTQAQGWTDPAVQLGRRAAGEPSTKGALLPPYNGRSTLSIASEGGKPVRCDDLGLIRDQSTARRYDPTEKAAMRRMRRAGASLDLIASRFGGVPKSTLKHIIAERL